MWPLQNRHQWQPLVQHIHGELRQKSWLRQDTPQRTVAAPLTGKSSCPINTGRHNYAACLPQLPAVVGLTWVVTRYCEG